MNVGVQPARPPRAFELEPLLFERQLKGVDRRVELARQPDRVEAKPGDRMVWLVTQDGIEVVDDLHAPCVERGGPRSFRDHRYLGSIATGGESGAVTRDSSTDDENVGQAPTIRRVSATSRLSWPTSSPVLGNLMSACR